MPEHLEIVVSAFFILSRSRPIQFAGMTGVLIRLPILASEAIAMAYVIGWDPMDFLHVIGQADTLYLAELNRSAANGHS